MLKCWNKEPMKRPTFMTIHTDFVDFDAGGNQYDEYKKYMEEEGLTHQATPRTARGPRNRKWGREWSNPFASRWSTIRYGWENERLTLCSKKEWKGYVKGSSRGQKVVAVAHSTNKYSFIFHVRFLFSYVMLKSTWLLSWTLFWMYRIEPKSFHKRGELIYWACNLIPWMPILTVRIALTI